MEGADFPQPGDRTLISDIFPRLASSLFSDVISQAEPVGIYFTFDDGPDPACTPKLLDLLSEKECKATFFVTGTQVEKYPDLVKAAHSRGHTIGSHGYSHRSFIALKQLQVLEDLNRSLNLIADVTGHQTSLFRPPYGRFGISTLRVARELGLKIALWSLSGGDYRKTTSETLSAIIINRVKPGDIVLLHDRGYHIDTTLSALSVVLNDLRSKGLEMLPLPE